MEKLKELRERTGAGISDCKKALDEAGGDMEKAIEILRKKGIAKAAKREGREVKEGVVAAAVNEEGNEGYIAEINSETDFAAKSERFLAFAETVIKIMREQKPQSREALLSAPAGSGNLGDELKNLSGVIGEKIDLKQSAVIKSGGTVAAYSHLGGKIGVIAAISEAGRAELAKEIAMQIAAANPRYISRAEVPAAEIEKEKEIYRAQLLKEGKPENMIENILKGKINKYLEEVCLLDQEYIKDDKKKIKDLMGEVKVEKFTRYAI